MTRSEAASIKQEYRFCSLSDTLNAIRDCLTAHINGVRVDSTEARNLASAAINELAAIRNAAEEMRFDSVRGVAHD